VNSIVTCCHSAKLCAHAAWAFRSQQLKFLPTHLKSKRTEETTGKCSLEMMDEALCKTDHEFA